MESFRLLKILPCIAVSGLLTVFIYFGEKKITAHRQTELGLGLARQISFQAESLALYAKSKQEGDPLFWAAKFLATGPDRKIISLLVSKNPTESVEVERFKYHPSSGIFSYAKLIDFEKKIGIRMNLQLGYVGFAGASSRLKNDVFICSLFFLFLMVSFFLAFGLPKDQEHALSLPPKPNPDLISKSEVTNLVDNWTVSAKSGLMKLGLNVKHLISHAQELTIASAQSKEQVEELSKISKKLSQLTEQMEPGELQNLVESSYNATQKALESYSDVFNVTRALDDKITKTTESLMHEAKLVQELKQIILEIPAPHQEKADSIK